MNVLRSILLTTTIMSVGLSFAQAGVVIGGTRVIFDGNKKEASIREGANKQVISSQADSLIKISRIWADFFPANTSNQPI